MKEKILLNKINIVKDNMYSSHVTLNNWQTRVGEYLSPNNYKITDEQWKGINIGDRWEAKDNITRWFKSIVVIPPEFEGRKVILDIEVGGEGLVYINGQMRSAITSYLQLHNATRTRVLISDCAKGNERIEVLIEVGLNYMEFAKYRHKGMKSVFYEFRKAYLAVVDTKVEDYYFNAIVAYEVIQVQNDSFIRNKIIDALESSLFAIDFDFDREKLVASIDDANKILNDKLNEISYSPQAEVSFTGHSHIDTAWLWPIKETIRKCARTFSNTIALLDEYPEHNFAQSQPQLYEYTKKYYPGLYEKIKSKIKEERWELVGNSWVECDTNVPSGESLVRQILYGRNFFKDEFGKWSDILWMPDVFGYSWALPQIIKCSGMKYFYTAKLNNNDVNRFPCSLFWWQGIDGTKVLSYLQRINYNGIINPSSIHNVWNNFDEKECHNKVMCTFGFGDGGGGPTYEMLEYSKRLKSFPGMPSTKLDSAQSFFEDAAQNAEGLPTWNNEMYYEFHRGTYTSQANTKKNNRKSELLYRQAEMLSSIALNKFNAKYPIEELTEGWKVILLNQFHDIIPGSSINEVYVDCEKDYRKVFNIGENAEKKALEAIVSNIDFKSQDDNYIVVFNYLSWPVTGPVEVKMPLQHLNEEGYTSENIVLEDLSGEKVACIIKETDDRNLLLCFEAHEVPPIGYTAYKITKAEREVNNSFSTMTVTQDVMENEFFKINIDKNGNITGIYDKKEGREVLAEGGYGNMLQIFEDKPERESAWNIDLEYQKKGWIINDVKSIEVKEISPIKGVLRISKAFNNSEIIQDITIYASTPRIDFYTQVEWQETEKLLKAAFEVDVLSPEATYEIAFGSIKRPTHWNTSWDKAKFEVPAHKWADLSEGGYGVSILNDCKYGYDIKDNVMRITLLKAPVYPDPVADKGHHEFVYSLYPHKGDWINGNVVHAGYELNVPLTAICTKAGNSGKLPNSTSFLSIDRQNVIVDTLKAAEDGNGLIIRLYESSGIRGDVKINVSLDIDEVIECNLMEEDERPVSFEDGVISACFKPFEIKTLRFK